MLSSPSFAAQSNPSILDWVAGISGAVAALATAAAFVAAVLAVKAANRTNAHQAAQIGKLEEIERHRVELAAREQAATISVWMSTDPAQELEITVANSSPQPVYDAVIYVQVVQRVFQGPSYVVRPQTTRQIPRISRGAIADANAAITHDLGFRNALVHLSHLRPDGTMDVMSLMATPYFALAISFRDNANSYWVRGFDGRLELMPAGFTGPQPLDVPPGV